MVVWAGYRSWNTWPVEKWLDLENSVTMIARSKEQFSLIDSTYNWNVDTKPISPYHSSQLGRSHWLLSVFWKFLFVIHAKASCPFSSPLIIPFWKSSALRFLWSIPMVYCLLSFTCAVHTIWLVNHPFTICLHDSKIVVCICSYLTNKINLYLMNLHSVIALLPN